MSEIKHPELSEQGRKQVELAEERMGALMKIRERFKHEKPFEGLKIGMALHVTKETAVLVRTLEAGGAEVHITGCNPLSTQDDVAAFLASEGTDVYGYKDESSEDYERYIRTVAETKPDLTVDDGGDLLYAMHTKYKDTKIIGGTEETTTGIIRLRAMEKEGVLRYPVVAVNDNMTKHLLDNYYGTGQSALDGIIRASNVLISGKTYVVVGYGDCGKGSALRAKGMGANVIVTEVNPFRALQAHLDGFRVMPMNEAAKIGDIFLTVTGDKHVISLEHIKLMKPGAMLANAGHFDLEIDVKGMKEHAEKIERIRPFFDKYHIFGKHIYLCAEGRLVNLGAAEGHPSEVMSTSFAGQSLALEYLVKNKEHLEAKVHTLPEHIDMDIAKLQLEAFGIKIDKLTEEQIKYLNSWREGTA